MSSVAFHSRESTVRVAGPERANGAAICDQMFLGALHFNVGWPTTAWKEEAKVILPEYATCFSGVWPSDLRDFTLCLTGFDTTLLLPSTRERITSFECALNTAVVAGSDPIRLLAHIHGQCEIHAYVEGPNRGWLAQIIDQGLKDNILRRHYDGSTDKIRQGEPWGWACLASMLRERDDGPVVMSYSVTDGFPNPSVCVGIEDSEAWYDLPADTQWDQAVEGLRASEGTMFREMKPETFAVQGFGSGISGYDIRAELDGLDIERRKAKGEWL